MLALEKIGHVVKVEWFTKVDKYREMNVPEQYLVEENQTPLEQPSGLMYNINEIMDNREVMDLIRSNKKLEAIKKLREITGMGLVEAKTAVEKIQKHLNMLTIRAW